MKKQYIQPQIEAYAVRANTILAGSLELKKGNTNEQCAKSSNPSFDNDDEEDY